MAIETATTRYDAETISILRPIVLGQDCAAFRNGTYDEIKDSIQAKRFVLAGFGSCKAELIPSKRQTQFPEDDNVVLKTKDGIIMEELVKNEPSVIFDANRLPGYYVPDVELAFDEELQDRDLICIVTIGAIEYRGTNQLLREGAPRNFAFFDRWETIDGTTTRPNIPVNEVEDLSGNVTIRFERMKRII